MPAGSAQLYDRAVEGIGDQTDDWDTTAKYVMMLTSSHSFNATHTTRGQIVANEVTGTGYDQKNLPTLAVDTTSAAGVAKFKAGNVSWPSSTITARYAVICQGAAATPATSDTLICSIPLDTATDVSSSNGTFTIQWNANGIFTLDHTP